MIVKKSNGGTAPCILLRLPAQDSSTVLVEDMDVCDQIQHNEVSVNLYVLHNMSLT